MAFMPDSCTRAHLRMYVRGIKLTLERKFYALIWITSDGRRKKKIRTYVLSVWPDR